MVSEYSPYLWLHPRYSALEKSKRVCFCRSAYLNLWLCLKYSVLAKPACYSVLHSTFRIFDFVLDTPSRQNSNVIRFCTRLFVSLAVPRILGSGWNRMPFGLPSIFVSWAKPKIRTHGKSERACFCPRLFVSLPCFFNMQISAIDENILSVA